MIERSMEDIKAEIEKLKAETATISVDDLNKAQVDSQVARAVYAQSELLSLSILGLGIFIFCCLTYLIRTGRRYDEILRTFVTTLILVVAVFLVVAGYSEKQIAPVMVS